MTDHEGILSRPCMMIMQTQVENPSARKQLVIRHEVLAFRCVTGTRIMHGAAVVGSGYIDMGKKFISVNPGHPVAIIVLPGRI